MKDRGGVKEGRERKEKMREIGIEVKEEPRVQDKTLPWKIAFDIGAGIMLAMGTNTCKSKGERVSKRSEPTIKRG